MRWKLRLACFGLCCALVFLPWPSAALEETITQHYQRTLRDFTAGKYEQAERDALLLLARVEKLQGKDRTGSASVLYLLASIYERQGRYADAVPLYERVLSIREKSLETSNPDVLAALNNLAVIYEYQGHYEQAAATLMRLLAIQEPALGPEHWRVADTLNNLAVVLYSQGRYQEAIPFHQRALAIREKA
ncbi:MAG: tetratricopeptide repeat protein, partial [Pseudomonadota bacterium]|nr:tetratricopeptide repeat protein [Pseudomonadota bacterium]